jgi:transposase
MSLSSASRKKLSLKTQALRQSGTLNRRARKVQDPIFLQHDFFDPEDLPQVKYEMLRRVQQEGMQVGQAAASFGFSRPSFYKAQEDFVHEGLAGLIPKRRGPKGRHKLTPEVIAFVGEIRAQQPSLGTPDLVQQIQEKFGIRVHRRTIERALVAAKKTTRALGETAGERWLPPAALLTEHYERQSGFLRSNSGLGKILLAGIRTLRPAMTRPLRIGCMARLTLN